MQTPPSHKVRPRRLRTFRPTASTAYQQHACHSLVHLHSARPTFTTQPPPRQLQLVFFTARRYASAVYAVVLCPCICLSVTGRYCIGTTWVWTQVGQGANHIELTGGPRTPPPPPRNKQFSGTCPGPLRSILRDIRCESKLFARWQQRHGLSM